MKAIISIHEADTAERVATAKAAADKRIKKVIRQGEKSIEYYKQLASSASEASSDSGDEKTLGTDTPAAAKGKSSPVCTREVQLVHPAEVAAAGGPGPRGNTAASGDDDNDKSSPVCTREVQLVHPEEVTAAGGSGPSGNTAASEGDEPAQTVFSFLA